MKELPAMKNPLQYSVIVYIEYLLAIVEIVRKVVIARGSPKKKKTRNQALSYGGSCFIERGNIIAIECQSL